MSNRNGVCAVLVAVMAAVLLPARGESPKGQARANAPNLRPHEAASRGPDSPTSQAPLETRQGVIIYRNGRVVAGNIHETPQSYIIVRDVGRITISRQDVEKVTDSMDAAYLYKLSRTNPLDPGEHMELAQWCLLVHLEERAIEELDRVLELRPQERRASQLKKLAQRQQTGDRAASEPPGGAYEPAPTLPGPADPAAPPQRVEPSPEAVGEFVRRVQPLLARSCGATGCHGAGHRGPFQLERVTHPTPRTTQTNLESTLAQIDYKSPTKSPLLEQALRPHGQGRHAPLPSGTRNPAYATLAQWVQQLAGPVATATVAPELEPVKESAPDVVQTSGRAAGVADAGRATGRQPAGSAGQAGGIPNSGRTATGAPANADTSAKAVEPPAQGRGRESNTGTPPSGAISPPKRAGRAPAGNPKATRDERTENADPFDPEVFNRQHRR